MRHLISTTAEETRCPNCHRTTLTAHDQGIHVRVDTKPLPDRQAELEVLLDGRETYTLTRAIRHLVLRTAPRIVSGYPVGTVHAEHRCVTVHQLTIDTAIGAS